MSIIKLNVESGIVYDACGIMKTDGPWTHIPRVHNLWVLGYCTAGTIYMNIAGNAYTIRPGDVFVLPARQLHFGTRASDMPISYYWMHFAGPDLEDVLVQGDPSVHSPNPCESYLMYHAALLDVNTISMLFNLLYNNSFAQHYTHHLQKHIFQALLYEISTQTLNRHAHKFDRRFVRILDYIRSHFTEDISVSSLSERFGYNNAYLCRLFKSRVGKTIKGYQTELRICYACQILVETDTPIKNLGEMIGFQSEKYFLRLFKQHMNMTPSAYRNAHQIITLKAADH